MHDERLNPGLSTTPGFRFFCDPGFLGERPAYGYRTKALARCAWKHADASLTVLQEGLEKDRQQIRDLASD